MKKAKVKRQGKLNKRVYFESVRMLFNQNYQKQSMLDETTTCHIWLVFLRDSVDFKGKGVPLFDDEYLTNGARYSHAHTTNWNLCSTRQCNFK